MKNPYTYLKLLLLTACCVFFMAPPVEAAKAPNCGKDGSGRDVAFCCGKDSNGQPIGTSFDFGPRCDKANANTISTIILAVIDFMAIGVGIAVVGGLTWGGFVYAQSGGDASKVAEAKNIIINAVIGLVLFFILWAGVNFLVPGGLFK